MTGIFFWLSVVLILYTYIGYPVLVFVLARLRKTEEYRSEWFPNVCLLIAAYNEEEVLAEKLEASLELDYPQDQLDILVAADGSDDRTMEIVQGFSDRGVRLSFQPERRGKLAAISHAMQQVTAEVVVFSDANNEYCPETVRELTVPFFDSHIGAVSGAKTIVKGSKGAGESEGLYWKYESFIKKQESRLGSCVGSSGEVFAIRRELFEPPFRSLVNDDFYMAMQVLRKGKRVVYRPQAKSFERISASQRDENLRRKRISAGRWQVVQHARQLLPFRRPLIMWQILSHKILRLLLPFAMLGALVSASLSLLPGRHCRGLAFLHLCEPWNRFFFLAQAVFYITAAAGMIIPISGKPGKLFNLPAFLVNTGFAVMQGFFHFLGSKDPAVWQKVRRERG